MKKFYLLTKTLLVATLLMVGASNAWADVISFSAQNRITNNGDGTFTTAGNAANQYALAIADLSGITGITGANKFITIEFDTTIPSGSRWYVGIGDKDTRGTNANGSSKATYETGGIVCRFGTGDGTNYRVNGSGSYSLFGVSVHATFTLNKRLGTYSLVLHNNSTDVDVYTASGTSTAVANATIIELYSWLNDATVTASDVTVTVKDTYEYCVNAVDGSSNKLKTLKTGSDVSGATVYYAYPRYINVNGTLYKKDKGSGSTHYEGSFTLSSAGDKNVAYAASSYTNVVYFAEGEDVLTRTTNGGNTTRCSMMATGRSGSATKIVTLPAGSYNINMAFFAAKTKYFYAYKGSESDANKIFEYEGTGSWQEAAQSAFTLTETTDILVKGGDSNNGIDYIIITGTYADGADATCLIENPDMETSAGGAEYWQEGVKGWNNCSVVTNYRQLAFTEGQNPNGAFTGTNAFENWTDIAGGLVGQMSQTISGIPNGVYKLQLAALVNSVNGQFIYGKSNGKTYKTYIAGDTDVANDYSVIVVVEDNQLEIGLDMNGAGATWVAIDNARLTYAPDDAVVSVTIGANKFTTFASPYPLDLTSATQTAKEFTAYRAASIAGSTVTFKDDVNQNVAANTGVLLKGTANATIYIPVVATGTALEGNAFHVNTSDATFDAEDGCTYYGMIKDSDPLAFGWFNPSYVAIPANKAYLVVNGGALAARQIEANFGDEILTGISEAKSEVEFAKEGKFVVDGKLLIFKKGMKFNANGARMK